MTKDEIMRLADAYAAAASEHIISGASDADEARAALEAAIVNQQLTVEQEAVAWGTEVKYGKLFFRIGVQSFAIDYTPEDEPDCSAGNAMAWMEKRLREALSKLAHPAPEAKQEPSGWLDEQTGDYSRVNRLGWSALYLHPAPVNQALLEKAAQLACDAVASNGGSVQMEAHVRAAIAGLRSLKEQEPVEPKCVVIVEVFGKDWRLEYMSLPVGRHKLYPQQFTYTHPAPSVNAQEGGGCTLAGPGRGDCEHSVGIPGKSIPGQHDGPDDTVDAHGKPNGWCWSCWKSQRISELEAEKDAWQGRFYAVEGKVEKLEQALDVALEAFETYFNQYPHMQKGYTLDAIEILKEVRRD